MSKNNFTQIQHTAFQLMRDLTDPKFNYNVNGVTVTKTELENTLRDVINNQMLNNMSFRKAMRNPIYANQVYALVEELIDISIAENIMDSPFINSFVEYRNVALGDKNEFYSEGGMLYAAEFAGNHWDTERQMLDLGSSFSIKTKWVYVHCYEDLERFTKGYCSLERLVDKVYQALNRYIKEHINATFEVCNTAVPASLTATGNTQEAVVELMDKVSALAGTDKIRIAGTRLALLKLGAVLDEKFLADSQKEALATNGYVPDWMGAELMVIPQVLKSGSVSELGLSNDYLYILAGDSKPIKVVCEGDTYTKMVTDNSNNDMTYEVQVQTKIGFGLVLPEVFGRFEFIA